MHISCIFDCGTVRTLFFVGVLERYLYLNIEYKYLSKICSANTAGLQQQNKLNLTHIMKILRTWHALLLGVTISIIGLVSILVVVSTDPVEPQSNKVRQQVIIEARIEIEKVIRGEQSYKDDIASIRKVKNDLVNERVTTEELGFHPDLSDLDSSRTWVDKLRNIAIVRSADRAVERLVALQEKISVESKGVDKSKFAKLQQYRKGTAKEVATATEDMRLIERAVSLVTEQSLQIVFGPVAGDSSTLCLDQLGPPEIEKAQEYLESIKTGIPPYYDWNPVD